MSTATPIRRVAQAFRNRELLLQLLPLIAQGMTNRQIAAEVGISPHGVKSRVTALLADLGARDRAHAVALAYHTGLLQPSRKPGDTVSDLSQHEAICPVLRGPTCTCRPRLPGGGAHRIHPTQNGARRP